jgi:hypothetical protein
MAGMCGWTHCSHLDSSILKPSLGQRETDYKGIGEGVSSFKLVSYVDAKENREEREKNEKNYGHGSSLP